MPEEIDKALTKFFASEFWKAVQQGYGMNLDDITINTPDHVLLQKLQENVYQFAAAKNHAQLKALSQALLDDEGNLRSFTDFRTAAAEVNNEFVNVWLKAEYNFAVASAQMASKWKMIEQTKDALPLLQYETVGDERVRLEHQELEGVVQPVDSTFWDIYYPPNGWGCRCDVRQLASGKITPMENIVLPEKMPDLFKFNSGKRGVAFPPGHPYYDGLPAEVKKQGLEIFIDDKKKESTDFFKPATTIGEAEKFAIDVLGMKYVNFKKLDIGVVNDMNRGLFNTKKLMPELPTTGIGNAQLINKAIKEEVLTAIKSSDRYKSIVEKFGAEHAERFAVKFAGNHVSKVSSGVVAWSMPKNDITILGIPVKLSKYNGVYVNEQYGKSKLAVDAMVIKNQNSKWFSQGSPDFSHIMNHELGHEIDNMLGIRDNKDFLEIFYREHKAGTNILAERLSMYGATAGKNKLHKRHEMIAECWAEFTTSNTPRPLAKEVGELMMKLYFEKHKFSTGKTYTQWLQENLKLIRQ